MRRQSANKDRCKEERDELRLLYDVSVNDLAFFKQQQWVVTNYCVAVYAALAAVAQKFVGFPLSPESLWVLIVLAGVTLLFGIIVVVRLQCSIELRRSRLKRVQKKFSALFHEAYGSEVKPKDQIYWLLCFVLVVGFLVLMGWVYPVQKLPN